MCQGCDIPIEDKYLLHIGGLSWHESCAKCAICRRKLQRSCYFSDGQLFCKHDYQQTKRTCSGCGSKIEKEELVMRVMTSGYVYHVGCFACVTCKRLLRKGDEFVMNSDDDDALSSDDDESTSGNLNSSKDDPMEDGKRSKPLYRPRENDDSDSKDSKRSKRPRTILNAVQRRAFKAAFEVTPKPCRKVSLIFICYFRRFRETLAKDTGLTVRVVQVWFQNQRAKMKKLAKRQLSQEAAAQKAREEFGQLYHDGANYPDNMGIPPNVTMTPQDNGMLPHAMRNHLMTSQPPFGDGGGYQGNVHTHEGMHSSDMHVTSSHNGMTPSPGNDGTTPIDGLYSMQNSYFSS
uniref:Uncharacterized protein n=1 Tax=Ciona savignyi TaxID=51511 RepID=H2Y8I1_CIOSA